MVIKREALTMLYGSIALGIYDPAILAKLVATLILAPVVVWPSVLAEVRQVALFLGKADLGPAALVTEYWLLRWQLQRGDKEGAEVTVGDIAYLASMPEALSDPNSTRAQALDDRPRLGAWRVRFDRDDGLRSAIDAGVPTTTYLGFIKSLDPARLNDRGLRSDSGLRMRLEVVKFLTQSGGLACLARVPAGNLTR